MFDAPALRPLVDDPERVSDDDSVLRVISPGFHTGNSIQSNAFEDYPAQIAATHGLGGPCASVNLRSIWEASGGSVEDLLAEFHPSSGIVEVSVGGLRRLRNSVGDSIPHGVMLDPRPGRQWHAVIFSLDGRPRTKGMKRAIVELATWFREPTIS